MIKSETFYRAECDEPKCGSTIPSGDDEEASHWPLATVEEALREPREVGAGVEVIWFYDGERTLCPRHHPDATPCGTCDGQGAVRVDGPPSNLRAGVEWSLPHHWEACPECNWVGFHPAPTDRTIGASDE
ncbi:MULTISPECIES: hypothetical protein [unclassified Microbacterium]|uniref:hypothetical protein n=1 Tax=unclassified Microbacterium TaxID=2609290 RepID=UPI0036550A7F